MGRKGKESERVVGNFGRADMRAAHAGRKKERARALRGALRCHCTVGVRDIQRKLGHTLSANADEEYREESGGRRRNKNYGERARL